LRTTTADLGILTPRAALKLMELVADGDLESVEAHSWAPGYGDGAPRESAPESCHPAVNAITVISIAGRSTARHP
jgi:hypothetical protein